jgi:hypothetical protein
LESPGGHRRFNSFEHFWLQIAARRSTKRNPAATTTE